MTTKYYFSISMLGSEKKYEIWTQHSTVRLFPLVRRKNWNTTTTMAATIEIRCEYDENYGSDRILMRIREYDDDYDGVVVDY